MSEEPKDRPALRDVPSRLEALYRHYNDEVRWLFSNRVVEALMRIDETRLESFLALNLPELVLNAETLSIEGGTFGQRAIARFLSGKGHLVKGLRVAVDELNIVSDAEGKVISYHIRTLAHDRSKYVYGALCELLWLFDAAGGDAHGLSSAAFGLPPGATVEMPKENPA